MSEHIKIRRTARGELIAVMPSGERIPGQIKMSINSDVESRPTATIELLIDLSEFQFVDIRKEWEQSQAIFREYEQKRNDKHQDS